MANLNKVMLIGRLTKDPVIRHTAANMPVADVGFAVNRSKKNPDGTWGDEPVFIDMTAFDKNADLLQRSCRKGSQIYVEGGLKLDQWTSQDGQKRSKLVVVIERIQLLDARQGGGGYDQGGGGGAEYGDEPAAAPPRQAAPRGRPAPPPAGGDNEDIPF